MWHIMVVINGLTFLGVPGFSTEEACFLAQSQTNVGKCINLPTPEEMQEENKLPE